MQHLAQATLLILTMAFTSGEQCEKRNGMTVSWHHTNNRVHITMSAPTDGWVGIGFNTGPGLAGTHLILGRVQNGKAEVVEHYTRAPGDYPAISALGGSSDVRDISGKEDQGGTTLRFSLPITPLGRFQRELTPGTAYELLMAFSAEDDFQHHSRMRTSASIIL